MSLERTGDSVERLETEPADIDKAIRRLTAAIAAGGALESLVAALAAHEQRRKEIDARLASVRAPRSAVDPLVVRAKLERYLTDWQGLLRGSVQQGQQILRRLIVGRLTFTPQEAEY